MALDGPWQSLPERVRQLEAMVAALTQRNEELQANSQQLTERLEQATAMEEVIRRSRRGESPLVPMQAAPPPPRKPPGHKRDRHGMHLVTGFAGAGVAWLWATRLRRAVTVSMAAAAVTTGAVTPSVISPGPPAAAGQSPASVRHHRQETGAPAPQPSRKKRQPSGRNERNTPGPSPSPSSAPAGTGSSPTPLPAVSPMPTAPSPAPPVPSPTPSVCVPPPLCHPLHACCDKDGELLAESVLPVTQTRAWLISKHRLRLAA